MYNVGMDSTWHLVFAGALLVAAISTGVLWLLEGFARGLCEQNCEPGANEWGWVTLGLSVTLGAVAFSAQRRGHGR